MVKLCATQQPAKKVGRALALHPKDKEPNDRMTQSSMPGTNWPNVEAVVGLVAGVDAAVDHVDEPCAARTASVGSRGPVAVRRYIKTIVPKL